MKSWLIIGIVILASASIVHAARIEGTVYNFYFERADKAIVEINTVPKQTVVADNGDYAITVKPGEYMLKAASKDDQFEYEENITISEEGTYNLDLILQPKLEAEEDLETFEEIFGSEQKKTSVSLIASISIAFAVVIMLYMVYVIKKKGKTAELVQVKQEADLLVSEILEFIKKEGYRVTQKDIREHFPASEAKISLVISELEHDGVIKKIKKGRGNIIILQKA